MKLRKTLAIIIAAIFVLLLVYSSAKAQSVLYPGLSPQPPTLPNANAPQWPWMMYHDWTGDIAEADSNYTNAEVEQIAALGAGLWDIRYIYTTNGQLELARVLAVNPDFKIMAYFKHTHAPIANIDNAAFPFWGAYDDLVSGNLALDTAASAVIAWESVANQLDNWVDLMPGDEGKTYRKSLLDDIVDLFCTYLVDENTWPVDPDWIQLDYISKTSQGYNVLSGQNALDMDQDGTAYASDSDEIAAYTDFQVDFISELKRIMGNDFRVMINGNAGYPDNGETVLAGKAHGATMEGFPDLPGGNFNDGQTIDQLRRHYGGFFDRASDQSWTVLFVTETINLDTTTSTSFAQAARIASMIWLVPWTRLGGGAGNPRTPFVDPKQSEFQAGQPLGGIRYESDTSGNRTWSRKFFGGTASLTANSANTIITSTWTTN